MTLTESLGLLGALGAFFGIFATVGCSIALWILSAIRKDIHTISQQQTKLFAEFIPRVESQAADAALASRIRDVDNRVNEIFADLTDPNMRPIGRRRKNDPLP